MVYGFPGRPPRPGGEHRLDLVRRVAPRLIAHHVEYPEAGLVGAGLRITRSQWQKVRGRGAGEHSCADHMRSVDEQVCRYRCRRQDGGGVSARSGPHDQDRNRRPDGRRPRQAGQAAQCAAARVHRAGSHGRVPPGSSGGADGGRLAGGCHQSEELPSFCPAEAHAYQDRCGRRGAAGRVRRAYATTPVGGPRRGAPGVARHRPAAQPHRRGTHPGEEPPACPAIATQRPAAAGGRREGRHCHAEPASPSIDTGGTPADWLRGIVICCLRASADRQGRGSNLRHRPAG